MPKDLTPLPLTDDDLDNLAPITEQDIVIAQNFITKQLDPRYKNLLLTQSQELAEAEEESE